MRASTKMTQNGKTKTRFSRRAQVRQDKNSCAYPKASVPSHEEQNLAQLAYGGKPLF